MDDKSVLLLMMFLCFLFMSLHYSTGNRYSHTDHPYLYDQMGGLASVANGRNMLQLEEADGNKRDVEALLSFKNGITSDRLGLLSNWTAANSHNVCRWYGISCGHHTKRVVAITLPGIEVLQGTISPSVGNLSFLRSLDLSGNLLRGTIPAEIGGLVKLEHLSLSGSDYGSIRLSGSIPPSLGNCSSLLELRVDRNELSGPIPAEFGRLVKLEYLGLSVNSLSGSIPPSLGNCSSLQELSFDYNNLSGPIPEELGRLVKLESLELSGNKLSGQIPEGITNLRQMANLYLRSNKLTRHIPQSIGNLSQLTHFDLSSNSLSGPIPSSFDFLKSLCFVDFSQNSLSGPIPQVCVSWKI